MLFSQCVCHPDMFVFFFFCLISLRKGQIRNMSEIGKLLRSPRLFAVHRGTISIGEPDFVDCDREPS